MLSEATSLESLNAIAQVVFDKKGFNILALDVRNVCTLTDFFLIGEGNVDKHVMALAKEVVEMMKKRGEFPKHVEGMKTGDWVVVDFDSIVVHLFKPGLRDRYRLEELWKEGQVIDLDLKNTRGE